MEDVKRMLTLQAEFVELLNAGPGSSRRTLDEVAGDYAVALSGAMEYCAPMPAMD